MIDWLNFAATTAASFATVIAVVLAYKIARHAFEDSRQNLVLARSTFEAARQQQILDDLSKVGQLVTDAVVELHPYWKEVPLVPPSMDEICKHFENSEKSSESIIEGHYWIEVEKSVHYAIEHVRDASERSNLSLRVLEKEWRTLEKTGQLKSGTYEKAAKTSESMRDALAWLMACLDANYSVFVGQETSSQHPGRTKVLKLIWDAYLQSQDRVTLSFGLSRIQAAANRNAGKLGFRSFRWPAADVDGGIRVWYDPDGDDKNNKAYADDMLREARHGTGSFYKSFEQLMQATFEIRTAESQALAERAATWMRGENRPSFSKRRAGRYVS